jgi:hypothetical protein
LSSVAITDGFPGDGGDLQKLAFEYGEGYYDRHEREFFGFKSVKTRRIDTQNGGVVYTTTAQEFENRNY